MKRINHHIYFLLLLTLFFQSCSNYIDKIYTELDSDDKDLNRKRGNDKFDLYRNKGANNLENADADSLQSPSSQFYKRNIPLVKRKYQNLVKKRYSADDLVDSSDEASLWFGRGQDNFLFSKNNFKSNGDIIIVKVMDKLKREITLELSRVFPEEKKLETKKDENNKEVKEQPKTPTDAKEEIAESDKIFDNISSVVVEEINKDHLLLRGRKDVLYKNRKRLIEVQALIARKDIADDDSIFSKSILESNINILR